MLNSSTIIKNKWKITGKIGKGAFGETFSGYDLHTGEEVAVKVEKFDAKRETLKLEVIALKKVQACSHVVRYIHFGQQDDFNFLVMERLGENLAELRKRTSNGTFSLCTTLKLSVQMIDALEGVHNLGYIHRDIKPANFVMGYTPKKARRCFLLDFGLARKYRLLSGEIRPPRKTAGFRGTARYASVNSHKNKELSRRDDLWSLFYIIVECLTGKLPWRKLKDKNYIGELKMKHTNTELIKDLPQEFVSFLEHLQQLKYEDTPDYDHLRSLLMQIYSRKGFSSDAPFDWEIDATTTNTDHNTHNNNNNNNTDINHMNNNEHNKLSPDMNGRDNNNNNNSYSADMRPEITGSSSTPQNRVQRNNGQSMFRPYASSDMEQKRKRRHSMPDSKVHQKQENQTDQSKQNNLQETQRSHRTPKCRCIIS